MVSLKSMSSDERASLRGELEKRYNEFKARNLALDMTRGKPCSEQLDLSLDMLSNIDGGNFKTAGGVDSRNYGGLDGIPEAKKLFADYMEVTPDELIIGGNSSLAMMHDTIVMAMLQGVPGSETPWGKLPKVKFLCPSPGYDRHFGICEFLGIEMITININADGPDMDEVERLVAEDDAIKGIWCVPKYSNPTGAVFSDEVVDRLASMKTKANDFRIFWDNAYTAHHLSTKRPALKNILRTCEKTGNPDRVYLFGSTSKISFAGAGIAMMAGSVTNMEARKKQMGMQTIGPDKINQLRHVAFFKDMNGIDAHMDRHAAIIGPKFDAVLDILEKELGGMEIACWSKPDGGYFVSLDLMEGCAQKVVKMANDAGVKLTPAGATFPYQKDPLDRNIRIAPTLPPLEEVKTAMELVAICAQLASIDKL